MSNQSDILRLFVRLPYPCGCGSTLFEIATGRGSHAAGLMCKCGRYRGSISSESYKFLSAVVRLFGRPAAPIEIRASARITGENPA
jgi:hypothetical protein